MTKSFLQFGYWFYTLTRNLESFSTLKALSLQPKPLMLSTFNLVLSFGALLKAAHQKTKVQLKQNMNCTVKAFQQFSSSINQPVYEDLI